MPIRVPAQTVVIHRDGQNVWPQIGVPFDFTDAEVHGIHSRNPAALRRPVVEMVARPEVTSVSNEPDGDPDEPAPVRAAPRKGGLAKRGRAVAEDDEL